jgi:hypothetical protein
MNKVLLRVGGVINLLFVLVHLAMVKPLAEALAPLSSDIQATASTWNIHVAFTLVIFAYLAFFQWRALLTTRLGQIVAIAIALFWFLRAINQGVFYGLNAAGLPLIGICIVVGLLHLVPVVREWRNVPSAALSQAAAR